MPGLVPCFKKNCVPFFPLRRRQACLFLHAELIGRSWIRMIRKGAGTDSWMKGVFCCFDCSLWTTCRTFCWAGGRKFSLLPPDGIRALFRALTLSSDTPANYFPGGGPRTRSDGSLPRFSDPPKPNLAAPRCLPLLWVVYVNRSSDARLLPTVFRVSYRHYS